jgi:hypothetical protein
LTHFFDLELQYVGPVEIHLAPSRFNQTQYRQSGGRFTTAALTYQTESAATPDIETHTVDSMHVLSGLQRDVRGAF